MLQRIEARSHPLLSRALAAPITDALTALSQGPLCRTLPQTLEAAVHGRAAERRAVKPAEPRSPVGLVHDGDRHPIPR